MTFLKAFPVGHTIEAHDAIGSTNDRALALAEAGAPEGIVVTAREQTAGRGRIGRSWVSGRDRGLYASILLRPKEVLVGGTKMAGVLIEGRTGAAGVEALVVGIGVNTRWEAADCSGDYRVVPTAVNLESGQPPEHDALLGSLLASFDRLYGEIRAGRAQSLVQAVRERLSRLGQVVNLLLPDGPVEGILEGIDPTGGLVLALPGGSLQTFHSGELDYADRH